MKQYFAVGKSIPSGWKVAYVIKGRVVVEYKEIETRRIFPSWYGKAPGQKLSRAAAWPHRP